MQITIREHLAYAYTGGKTPDPAQPTIVFIHGAAHDHSVWSLQSRYFAAHGHNVLALDLPGHGRSAGRPEESIGALADWVIELLDRMEIGAAALVGHSMGVLVALETAGRCPERASRLALLGCTVPMAVSDGLLAAARDNPSAAIAMISQWSHGPATLGGGSPVPGLWLPGVNSALMARARPGVLHRDLQNCREYDTGLDAAARVSCPTLLLSGSRDLMTPGRAIEPLRAALSQVRTVVIDGAGHAMMSERADAVLDALSAFLRA